MPHRILLADDSLTIQKVVELTFSEAEFEIRAVGNGDDAVRELGEFRPDIVLADAFMPGLTGYDVCERVKALGGSPAIPVILLAGTFEPFDRARAERSGADSIVTKPFDSHALASLVRELVEKARHQATLSPAVPADVVDPAASGQPVPSWDLPTDPDVRALRPPPEAVPFAAETGTDALFRTAAIPVGVLPADAAPQEFELADPFADAPAPTPTEPTEPIEPLQETGVPATTLPLEIEDHLAERAEAITGPIPVPQRVEDPFGPPPVLEPQDDFLSEPEGVQPRDIEADLEAFESSGKGRTRPEVWDQAEAMGLSGPREESAWPEEPGLRDDASPSATGPADAEPAHEVDHQLAPDAGAFDLGVAEGVEHRDLEALAAEARRTDLNELIPVRAAASGIAAAGIAAAPAPGPVALSEADVDRIARRVAELVGEACVRDVAWEVVPEIAERVVRQRIRELEGE